MDALKAAMQGERRAYQFYYAVAGTTKDPEIAAAANEFVKEEAKHVEILDRWIEQEETLRKALQQAVAAVDPV
ncbi:MAG: ferritin family protein [Bryobacteraceae bacterium]|jgi:rubrerythrin